MHIVVGVRFKSAGKIYYFDPNEIVLAKNDHVVVETARGIEYGEVVVEPKRVPEEEIVAPLKKVVRKATPEDDQRVEENRKREKEAFDICVEKIESHNMSMKLVDVEFTFDNNKIIFYFTADGRVDFRDLVKDLAAIFKTRIELRQIGVRDEAKMLGGLGPCGKPLCCSTFLGDFEPVSIRMAKEQSLSLNPTKISGICSRLMCCLKYEQDNYEEIGKKMPRINGTVMTPKGKAIVVENKVILERVKVKVTQEDGVVELMEFPLEDIQNIDSRGRGNRKEDDEELLIDEEMISLLDE